MQKKNFWKANRNVSLVGHSLSHLSRLLPPATASPDFWGPAPLQLSGAGQGSAACKAPAYGLGEGTRGQSGPCPPFITLANCEAEEVAHHQQSGKWNPSSAHFQLEQKREGSHCRDLSPRVIQSACRQWTQGKAASVQGEAGVGDPPDGRGPAARPRVLRMATALKWTPGAAHHAPPNSSFTCVSSLASKEGRWLSLPGLP